MSHITLLNPEIDHAACSLPLLTSKIPAGFPSPAEEYLGDTLNLNQYLIDNPATTFFARVDGHSMSPGIMADDIVVIDRSITPKNNHIIVAVINDEFSIKRLQTEPLLLISDNPDYPNIPITGETELMIWGKVTYCISKK